MIFLGVLTLAGWVFDIETFKTVLPGLVSMKPNSAVCFTAAGTSLLLQSRPQPVAPIPRRLGQFLGLLVAIVGILSLVEYIMQADLGLDHFLFRESIQEAGPSFPGRMSVASSVNFVLLGTALLALDVKRPGKSWLPAQQATLAAMVITLLAFIGYFYRVENLSRIARYTTIALHTVVAFWLLGLGILFARPKRGLMIVFTSDNPGGILARRMLPTAILLPLLAGWLAVLGERAGVYELGFGSALLATVLIFTFTALIARAGVALNQAGAGLRESQENLRGLAARLLAVREEERTEVAREIHDVLAQELTRLKMDIAWLNRRLAEPLEESKRELLRKKLAEMTELTDAAVGSVQRIATELRPVVLDSLGLSAAIEWQTKDFETRAGIACEARVPERDLQLARDHATALFRILQEALTNVARHAQATRVAVELEPTPGWISLTVRDNGRGIGAAELTDSRSLGLLGMRERATLLGGECRVGASPDGGTAVIARLPFVAEPNSSAKLP